MNEGPPLMELSDIDSAFQLTEHLKALHHNYTHPPGADTTQPISRSTAASLAAVPNNTDRALWLYELCRFLVQKINVIMVSLFADSPPCSSATCPEMRASEWQYLCAVHDPPKSCCAIDYCCHTLDWAANTLTSPKHFPSRLALGSDGVPGGVTRSHQERQLTNIFRRVYRIFAHAWFQHRDAFWRIEGRTGLYIFFKTICDSYALIPEDNYTIPPEAEGLEKTPEEDIGRADVPKRPSYPPPIAKRNNENTRADGGAVTARKHRSAPSRSGSSVATVMEENEEEETSHIAEPDFLPPSKQPTAKPSAPAPALPSHKPSVERITDVEMTRSRVEPAPSAQPPETTSNFESSIARSSCSNGGISPSSPHAMTSADLAGARNDDEHQTESGQDVHAMEVAESEQIAKTALTKAEGSQATATEAGEAQDATKTVED
ncbi:MAG: hypothetical protein Q9162_000136 [Coniocarpon cinnabarinum]